jgi:hypothetical protein
VLPAPQVQSGLKAETQGRKYKCAKKDWANAGNPVWQKLVEKKFPIYKTPDGLSEDPEKNWPIPQGLCQLNRKQVKSPGNQGN